jgi:hypothetical protein
MIRVHSTKFEFERHGLEAPPSCQHYVPSSYHSYWNYLWRGKLELKVDVLWILVEGHPKMLADFAAVIRVASVSGTCQTDNFLMSLFPTIITKEILRRNVAPTSFVERIAIIVTRR